AVGMARVTFRYDGNPIANDTSSPYSYAWNTGFAADGTHVLDALAQDTAGNLTASAGVSVTIDNNAPTVGISSPLAGASVNGSVAVTATASDTVGVVGVQFLLDGANLGAEDTTSPYSVAWDTTAASAGAHTLTARARDATGN